MVQSDEAGAEDLPFAQGQSGSDGADRADASENYEPLTDRVEVAASWHSPPKE